MQMTVGRRETAAPSEAHGHYRIRQWREGICMKKEQGSKSKSLLSISCCLYCSCQTWQSTGLVGLGTSKVSLSLFIFLSCFSLSFSLSEPRPGYSWACSIVPVENCQSRLLWLNTGSRSFIKELICYSLPLTHSLSPTLFRFPLAHCATFQLPFLVFSLAFLYTVFTLSICEITVG